MVKHPLIGLALLVGLHAGPAVALNEVICTGDCNYDGTTAIDELLKGVAVTLDEAAIDTCRGFDLNGNGIVTVDELLGGVRNALDGCPSARFESTACDPTVVPDGQDPGHMRCGFAIVPENRSRHNGHTIRLAVAVLRATGPSPAPDPIVHLGPGLGPILDGLMQMFTADFAAPLQASRDLVFFDIRGSGRSTPSLACPEVLTLSDAYADQQSIEADTARDAASLLACHDRLAADGTDFADYTTAGIAADARDILRTLGYQQWNLYGWSQSTRIAEVLMRDSPAGEIRSVVLDSPIPLSRAHIAEHAAHLERVLRLIIRDCAADAGCAQAYPNLEQTMFGVFPALNAAPLTIEPTDPATGEPFRIVLSGDRLLNILVIALQSTAIIPFAPILAQELASHDTSLFTAGAAQLAGVSQGDAMSQSVICQDQAPLMTPAVLARALEGVDPNIAHAVREGVVGLVIAPCSGWTGVTPISDPPPPLTSDLPTLILSGEYDPATPPDYAHELAATLSNGAVVEFRGHGHGELYVIDAPTGQISCAMRVMAEFVADPSHAPDTSCAAALPPPHFVGT